LKKKMEQFETEHQFKCQACAQWFGSAITFLQRTGEKNSIRVKVSFKPSGAQRLIIEEWKEPEE